MPPVNVTVTRTYMNSELKEPIKLRVGPKCTIEGLKTAIKTELKLGEDAADFLLFYWEICLNDNYSKETKLVDLGFGHAIDLSMEYPTATLRDVIKPQHPVKISSDETRRIIHPKSGMRASYFFTQTHVKNFGETELTLTSKDDHMVLYIEDPDVDKEVGKYHTLRFLLPRSTRKIFIEKIPQTEGPNGSRFKLKIVKEKEDWTNDYKILQSVEEPIEFKDGKQRIFLEGSKAYNVLATASLCATVGTGVGTAVGGPAGAAIGGAIGAIGGATAGALLPK